jgi:LmbE family N-acetylglucosaminyl deacetylase
MTKPVAIAIAAHPDDIEFVMAGTLCLLREAGYATHYLNVSSGSGGSLVHGAAALRRIRRNEARRAAALLGVALGRGPDDPRRRLLELTHTRCIARCAV